MLKTAELMKAYRIAKLKLKAESQRTYVGYLWWFIQPVLDLGIYYLLFSVILKRGGEDYLLFLFLGLVMWKWLVQIVLSSCGSLVGNKGLILSFPTTKYVYPATDTFMHTIKFLPVLLICVLGYAAFYGVSIHHLELLPLVLTQFILCLSCSFFCAAIIPFLLDLQLIFPVLVRLLFYPSGILFDPVKLSDKMQKYIYLNPLVGMFESYRNILMKGKGANWGSLLAILIFSAAIGSLGLWILEKNNKRYAKMRF